MSAPTGRRVLYLSYDGMTDPLGGSQVLPYLVGLAASGHSITLVSLEKPAATAAARAQVREICRAAGIDWRPLVYHKQPLVLSTLYDLVVLRREVARLHAATRFDWLHCRSYLTALIGLGLKRKHGVKLLFDMRGFWADERVEGGLWDLANPLFRAIYAFFKRREAELLRLSDHVVMLTDAGKQVLLDRGDQAVAGRAITVIPCCVDFETFNVPAGTDRASARALLGIAPGARVVAYLGSIGTWYMLDEMLDCFAVELARRPEAIFLFISRDDPHLIRAAAAARGVPLPAIMVHAASRVEVAHFLAAADYGLFFIRPTFSKIASCPTKLGELLAMGLPVLTNGGVGDVDTIIADSSAGVIVAGFDKSAYADALDRLEQLPRREEEWRQRARRWFDLDDGVAAYDAIYRERDVVRDARHGQGRSHDRQAVDPGAQGDGREATTPTSAGARRVLYLSYDGMTDPLGGSQVLPYLVGLAALGHRITLVSLEKPAATAAARAQVREICAAAGIEWRPLTYHNRVPIASAAANVMVMSRAARTILAKTPHDIVHCRSYLAAIAGIRLKRRFGVRFLFDMRGFWPEERLEGGGWHRPPFGPVYSYFKRRERDFFRDADAIVSLTSAARDQMATRPVGGRPLAPVTVIPCCVDFDHFAPPGETERRATRAGLGIAADATVVGYLGSLGGNYMLDEMLRFFVEVRDRRPGARLLFVTRNAPAEIIAAARAAGIAADEMIIRAATRAEVPRLIAAADIGVAFKQPSFSALACSPTKLGEMLALGIPMVVNAGVGDVEAVARDSGAAIVVERFDKGSLGDAATAVLALDIAPAAIRAAARRWFELSDGIAGYDAIYREIGAL